MEVHRYFPVALHIRSLSPPERVMLPMDRPRYVAVLSVTRVIMFVPATWPGIVVSSVMVFWHWPVQRSFFSYAIPACVPADPVRVQAVVELH